MHSAYCSLWCVLRHSSWLSSLALNQSWWWSTLKNKPFTFCQTCPGNFSTHAGMWANTDLGSTWFALHAIHRVRIYSSGSMKTQLYKIQFHFLIYTVSVKHITEHMYRLMCLKTWNSSLLLCLIMFEMSTFIIRHWWKDMDGHQWTPWVYFQLRITYIFYIFLILCLCGQ